MLITKAFRCFKISHFHILNIDISSFHIVLKYEHLYLENLPTCDTYEKSYMHRDVITHIIITKYLLRHGYLKLEFQVKYIIFISELTF